MSQRILSPPAHTHFCAMLRCVLVGEDPAAKLQLLSVYVSIDPGVGAGARKLRRCCWRSGDRHLWIAMLLDSGEDGRSVHGVVTVLVEDQSL